MKAAVIYARVSSKEQQNEGFSIPAQLKLLRKYAISNGYSVLREFVDVETAKSAGRKEFGAMCKFLETHRTCRAVIVEKTDRLYRNFKDYVTLEELEIEIHLPKENQIISKDSQSQAKLMHGIHVVIARNYIDNLREEVKKGMREKAEQGIYPSRPPKGYRNNVLKHTIEIDHEQAPIARRMFELYATGQHSIISLRRQLKGEFGQSLAKGYLHRLLQNPFYKGQFFWQGKLYNGTHKPLVSAQLFEQVQAVFRGHNKPKFRKYEFAFRGIVTCKYDGCLVTAEQKKNKYTYYHCTGFRGKCELPYFREEELGERLGEILKNIHVPDPIFAQLRESLLTDKNRQDLVQKQERERLQQRLSAIHNRLDQAYQDKLDGKISEEFWERKSVGWQAEEQQIQLALQGLEQATPDRLLTGVRILELANKAHSLYLSQLPSEQAKLLRMVLSNCAVDAATVYPTYRKPFDLIVARTKNEEWRALGDDLRTFLLSPVCNNSSQLGLTCF